MNHGGLSAGPRTSDGLRRLAEASRRVRGRAAPRPTGHGQEPSRAGHWLRGHRTGPPGLLPGGPHADRGRTAFRRASYVCAAHAVNRHRLSRVRHSPLCAPTPRSCGRWCRGRTRSDREPLSVESHRARCRSCGGRSRWCGSAATRKPANVGTAAGSCVDSALAFRLIAVDENEHVLAPIGGEGLLRRFPDRVRLETVAGAGHALLPEQPRRVEKAVLAYLDSFR